MPSGSYRQIVATKGLQGFLWTQFLGAFNDNFFKIVVSMVAVQRPSAGGAGRNLSLVRRSFRRAVPAVLGLRRAACRRVSASARCSW